MLCAAQGRTVGSPGCLLHFLSCLNFWFSLVYPVSHITLKSLPHVSPRASSTVSTQHVSLGASPATNGCHFFFSMSEQVHYGLPGWIKFWQVMECLPQFQSQLGLVQGSGLPPPAQVSNVSPLPPTLSFTSNTLHPSPL